MHIMKLWGRLSLYNTLRRDTWASIQRKSLFTAIGVSMGSCGSARGSSYPYALGCTRNCGRESMISRKDPCKASVLSLPPPFLSLALIHSNIESRTLTFLWENLFSNVCIVDILIRYWDVYVWKFPVHQPQLGGEFSPWYAIPHLFSCSRP